MNSHEEIGDVSNFAGKVMRSRKKKMSAPPQSMSMATSGINRVALICAIFQVAQGATLATPISGCQYRWTAN